MSIINKLQRKLIVLSEIKYIDIPDNFESGFNFKENISIHVHFKNVCMTLYDEFTCDPSYLFGILPKDDVFFDYDGTIMHNWKIPYLCLTIRLLCFLLCDWFNTFRIDSSLISWVKKHDPMTKYVEVIYMEPTCPLFTSCYVLITI